MKKLLFSVLYSLLLKQFSFCFMTHVSTQYLKRSHWTLLHCCCCCWC